MIIIMTIIMIYNDIWRLTSWLIGGTRELPRLSSSWFPDVCEAVRAPLKFGDAPSRENNGGIRPPPHLPPYLPRVRAECGHLRRNISAYLRFQGLNFERKHLKIAVNTSRDHLYTSLILSQTLGWKLPESWWGKRVYLPPYLQCTHEIVTAWIGST